MTGAIGNGQGFIPVYTLGNNILRIPTGTVIDSTARVIEDGTGTDSLIYIATDFLGIGTSTKSQTWTDRFGADPSIITYDVNFHVNRTTRAVYFFGNTNTGADAYTQILFGNGTDAQYGSIVIFPKDLVISGRKSPMMTIISGSGMDAFGLFADYGQIQLGTVADTGDGYNGIVVGVDPTQYIGIGYGNVSGSAPAYGVDMRKTVNDAVACHIHVQNYSNGSAAFTKIRARNDTDAQIFIGILGTGFATTGAYKANTGVLWSDRSIMFVSDTTGGDFWWYTNGATATDFAYQIGFNKKHYMMSPDASKYSTIFVDNNGDRTIDLSGGAAKLNIFVQGATFGAPVRHKVYATVAALPAGTQGDWAAVLDADTPTWGATVVGGGGAYADVSYDGTNWIVK